MPDEIVNAIEQDEGLRAIQAFVAGASSADPGHDIAHAHRVARWMLRLDPSVERRAAFAAALLHDVVNLPKNHPERATASARSAALARSLLLDNGFGEDEVDTIVRAIEDHSFSRGVVPRDALGRALQDADRLEALGAIGLMRTFATGALMGASFFDAVDPWAQWRPHDDLQFTVDHFATKLLGLPETLTTEAGRAEARRRVEIMRAFLGALGEEIGSPRPE